eukprot:scaffold10226_cov124-Isochrysis_galbana.AAC.5
MAWLRIQLIGYAPVGWLGLGGAASSSREAAQRGAEPLNPSDNGHGSEGTSCGGRGLAGTGRSAATTMSPPQRSQM